MGVGLLWAGLADRPGITREPVKSPPARLLACCVRAEILLKKKWMCCNRLVCLFLCSSVLCGWNIRSLLLYAVLCSLAVPFFFFLKKGTVHCAAILTIQRCSLSSCYRRLSSCCVSGGRFAVLMAAWHLNEAAGVLVFSIFVFLRARCVCSVTDFIISAQKLLL